VPKSTVETFLTPEDGWALVTHFLGNILLGIRLVAEKKENGWEDVVNKRKKELSEKLGKICWRMIDLNHIEDAEKINQILNMVYKADFTDPSAVGATADAIYAKNLELNSNARKMDEMVKKYFLRE
jgi:hypothetical protein